MINSSMEGHIVFNETNTQHVFIYGYMVSDKLSIFSLTTHGVMEIFNIYLFVN